MNLQDLISKPRGTPRAEFQLTSHILGTGLFACGGGIYLLATPDSEGDRVYAVGWANSDPWAMHTWTQFSGPLDTPAARGAGPPSLQFLGRPEVLSFASVLSFERAQPDAQPGAASWPVVPTPVYRFFDLLAGLGEHEAFRHYEIPGTDGVHYFYASEEPLPEDLPVALEIWLPEHK